MDNKVLLDLRGLVIRAMYSEKDPDKEKGELPDPEWGVSKFIEGPFLQALNYADPINIVAVLDGGNKYRKALYSEYKAHRKEGVEGEKELITEVQKRVERFLRYMGVTTVKVPGVEADDIIAMLRNRLPCNKLIVTVDQDLIQLVRDDTIVLINWEAKEDMKGVKPQHIALYKSIVGDSSDGYKGIKGLGPVAWKALVDEVGEDGLDELTEIVYKGRRSAMREVAEAYPDHKVIPKLYSEWGEWRRSYYLAILHPELCYGANPKDLIFSPEWERRVPSKEKILEILDENYINLDLVKTLSDYLPEKIMITPENLHTIKGILEEFKEGPFVAFDYETEDFVKHEAFDRATKSGKTYVDTLNQTLVSCSFVGGKNLRKCIYISTLHSDKENRVDPSVIGNLLKDLEEAGVKLVAHNMAFEYNVTKENLGIELKFIQDTMPMGSYYREEGNLGLKDMSLELLRYRQATFEETTQGRGMSELTSEEAFKYGVDDSLTTAHLRSLFEFILPSESRSFSFIEEKENAFANLLARNYSYGVEIDWDRLEELHQEDLAKVKELDHSIRSALEEHCSNHSETNARNYWDSIYSETKSLLIHKYKDKDPDFIKQKMEDMKASIYEKTRYIPYRSSGKNVKFVATPKGITSVAADLGISQQLEKITASDLTEYLMTVEAKSQEQKKFLKLLGESSSELKKREGENYQKFYDFCYEVKARSAVEVFEGFEMNLNSPPQKQQIFYLFLGLPVKVRTNKAKGSARDVLKIDGSPSTSEEAIEYALAFNMEKDDWRVQVLEDIQELMSCLTRMGLYWGPYPLWKHPKTGRIHPSFIPAATRTRRPTGSSPNFFQLAKKDGGRVRSIVKSHKLPKKKTVVISGDFNGQELRITGSEANDPVMIDSYCGEVRKDIHTVTARGVATREVLMNPEMAEYFTLDSDGRVSYEILNRTRKDKNLPFHDKADSWRRISKTVNFLIIFGGSAFTLAKKLRIPETEADAILREVFGLYARLTPWQKEVVELARQQGYVTTAYGNRIHATDNLFSSNDSLRKHEERKMINGLIQPCASDILKVLSHNIISDNIFEETEARLIAPVYDEITSSVLVETGFEYIKRMSKAMAITPPGHPIPMEAEFSIGYNWGNMIEIGYGNDITEDTFNEAMEQLDAK